MTERYALFGSPIDQSPSPAMHTAAFRALGIDAGYERRPASASDVDVLLREMDTTWRGANVTTPLKEVLARHVQLRGHAARAQAVNTLSWQGKILVGDLTDVEGIAVPLTARGIRGGSALVIGAGGAARAAVLALDGLGLVAHLAARRPDQARQVLDSLAPEHEGEALALSDRQALAAHVHDAAVIVQATPAGRDGESLPLPWDAVPRSCLAFEMLYAPRRTPFTVAARAHGCAVIEGWEMLLAQGAASFTVWTGRVAPLETMRNALLAAL